MKTSKLIYAVMLLLAGLQVFAQENNWNDIGANGIVSRDTTIQKEYTLVFVNKSPGFDSTVKRRLIETFFKVYPQEAKTYNPNTLKKVIFIIDPDYKGVAATSGSIVRYNPTWFVSHPGDIDVVTHEVMHIVQAYPGDAGPGWLTEGIADYVRYKFGVDNAGAPWALTPFSAKQNYTNAYRITARFLVWAEKQHDKNLVKELDAALRSKTYTPELWTKFTGKTVDELWTEYAANPAI